MNETAITLYDRIQDPLTAVERLGKVFAKSGMFGCEKEEQGQLLALACMATKKDPFEFLDENHLINGRRSMRADRMLANFRARGGKVKWKQFDEKAAIGLFDFEGSVTEIGYSIDDARKADLIRPKSGWEKNPGEMLRARCISRAVRMLCPEAICGAYLPDEKPVIDTEATVSPDAPKAELFPTPAATSGSPNKEPVASAPVDAGAPVDAEIVPDPQPQAEPPKPAGDYMDFCKLIKGHEEVVFNWLVKQGKITANQKLSDTPAGLMRKACEKPEKFLATVGVKS
jgi:RecT family protein